jgi:hypothetical protein
MVEYGTVEYGTVVIEVKPKSLVAWHYDKNYFTMGRMGHL